MTGLEFGADFAERPREVFEVALVEKLAALEERLTVTDLNAEEGLVTFDQAAWEAGKPRAIQNKENACNGRIRCPRL